MTTRSASTTPSSGRSSRRSSTLAARSRTTTAVGLEHAPWLEEDISAQGVAVMSGLFEAVDPGGNFNPRKIVV
ncbi:FAD-linked oxidase C-terminal domain-containing protein [Actinacidiphila glaucinigra]|uniref:FAD-linked oxidase C-terminal domain-containing protein n=1 Tax=Actinacidiphila glaucinigra TaxID=235986 RepID=UPI0036A3F234